MIPTLKFDPTFHQTSLIELCYLLFYAFTTVNSYDNMLKYCFILYKMFSLNTLNSTQSV